MLFRRLTQLLPVTNRADTVYECRRCGTTVDEDTDTCPECESEEIARYQLS